MYYSPIKKPRLHVLHFCPIEAGPCNIVEGTAAAKGAVPPEGWGWEPDDRKAKAPVRITQTRGVAFVCASALVAWVQRP